MKKYTIEERRGFIYDPFDKWWKYFLLWMAYNGKVRVYKYKEKQNTKALRIGKKEFGTFAILAGIVMGQIFSNVLRECLNYEIDIFDSMMECAISAYFVMVIGIFTFEKVLIRKKKLLERMDYYGAIEFRLFKVKEFSKIKIAIIIMAILYFGLTGSIMNNETVYGLITEIVCLFFIPSIITIFMGNLLEIPDRMEAGEFKIIE